MPDYSLVPVDYQPDFDDYSLVPVDHDPFAADGVTQQAQIQQPPTPTQPAQPQPQTQPRQPATGAGQPDVNGPATGNSPSGSGGGAARRDPNDPAADQDRSPAPVLFPGYADPTPMLDHQPVSSAQGGSGDIPQKIVGLASGQIGSGAWDANVAKGSFAEGKDKCNLFVYDTLADAGASPGLPNGHWWWKHYPPTAANWADPAFAIPGWRVLGSGESPQPGDVVGQRIQWPNGATGHVMIVGPNADFIGVGESEKIEDVGAKMMGKISLAVSWFIVVSSLSMRRARIWLLLCFGCLFGCCPGIAVAEPSSREAGGSYDARSYGALVDRLITSDPQDWCVFGSCPRPAPPEPSGGSAASSYEAYADKVVATDRNYERIGVSVYGWLGINNFQQLVDASARNPDFCIRFLSDKKHSERQRHVAILSMYGLSIDQHVVFVRNLMKLRDQDLISPEELLSGLYPRLSIDLFFRNYQDMRIRLLLREMKLRHDIGLADRDEIERILSGKALLDSREFDRECCSAPQQ